MAENSASVGIWILKGYMYRALPDRKMQAQGRPRLHGTNCEASYEKYRYEE